MSFSHFHFLLSFLTLISPALGDGCQPKAISLPFASVKLITTAEVRGVLWQIGGPNSQNVTLMPSAYYVDTYLWATSRGLCPTKISDNYGEGLCPTYRGGLYDRSISATENDVANMVSHTFDDTIANWTRDDIRLQDNTSLSQHEFGLRTNEVNAFVHKGELGLAKNSSFLKTLLDTSKTSSNVWSFFWGNEVTDEPRDGSLVLGGYDQALVGEGSNLTVPFSTDKDCKEGIIVSLTSLGLDGGDAWKNLPDLEVCVIPATSNIMTIPVNYWDAIAATAGLELNPFHNGTAETHFFNTTLVTPASAAAYKGDMKVTINNDLTVTIPNKQLFFGEHYIASSGIIKTKSDVIQMPIVRIRPGDGMMPRLGGMFFSSAVLTVNHDKNQFTIAQAQTKSAPSNLVAYDTKNDCVGPVKAVASNTSSGDPKESNGANSGSSSGSSGSNPDGTSNNSNTSSSSSTKSTLSGGAIAGIVIGTLAFLSLIGAALFLIRRQRRRAVATSPSELAAFGPGSSSDGPPTEKYAYASEMYVDNQGTELYSANGGNGFAHEMDGGGRVHEVPAGEYAVVKDGSEAQGRLA